MAKFEAIINKLFDTNKSFVREDFLDFVGELTGNYPKINTVKDDDGDEYIKLSHGNIVLNKLGIFIYKMPNASKVERARSYQRNKISKYLKNEGIYNGIDCILAVFHSEDSPDWRLSFIKQEFKLSENEFYANGKKKIINELTPAKRYSFLVEANSKNLTVKQRLNELFCGGISVSEIEKAFSVEKVSKEFFSKYVKLYEKLDKAFENDKVFLKIESESNNGDEHFRENFVKKLLGQIVFLYFLQKKGWLGVEKDAKWGSGDKNFLRKLLKECLEGGDKNKEFGGFNFFNDYLEWLFYAFLNTKEENRKAPDYFNRRIPYLNGGLFEPINNYIWEGPDNILLAGKENNLIFKEIFDTFDEYNFTVYENDPLEQDVAIDPEMLGKVFENLLPENERKGKGAFYTPREIVHYMCRESLKNYLINRTGISEEKINGLFERKDSMLNLKMFGKELSNEDRYKQFGEYIEYAQNIVDALRTIKIVDPAVGSGAFPMGLLKEIVSLRKYLQENILLEEKVSEYLLKKETLENCIYGVDLDPGAVEIAKLRFWLSLVIEEEASDVIEPLPNLDYKIMQGNSLIEDIVVGDNIIRLDIDSGSKKITKKEGKIHCSSNQIGLGLFKDEQEVDEILKRLKFLHKIYFTEKDNLKKREYKNQIDHVEKELIRISGEVEVEKIQKQIENIEGKYILSGMSWDDKDSKKAAELYSQISSIKETEEKYNRDNIRSFFPWKLHFGEVFQENGGFDIVIGNPPYVGESGNKDTFQHIYKGNLGEFYFRNMDLFYFFFHLGINLGKEKTQICLISTNYYITADGAFKLRKDIKNRTIIKKLINLNELKIFESAKGQHNIITLLEKGQNSVNFSKNCITARKGYYADSGKVLDNILGGKDTDTKYYNIQQSLLYEGDQFYIRLNGISKNTNDGIGNILNKIKESGDTLKNIVNINQGLVSGLNKISESHISKYPNKNYNKDEGVFVLTNKEINEKNINSKYVRPFFKNSDIHKYYTKKSNDLNVLYFKDNGNKHEIDDEKILEHFIKYKELLIDRLSVCKKNKFQWNIVSKWINREDYYLLFYPRNLYQFENEKIVVPYRSKENTFGYSIGPWYGASDMYFITEKDSDYSIKYLLGLLNSQLYYLWLCEKGKRKGEILELFVTPLSEIPIKKISKEEQKPFINLVDQILEITKNEDYLERDDLINQVKILENRIDELVYNLYELSPEEIEIVKNTVK